MTGLNDEYLENEGLLTKLKDLCAAKGLNYNELIAQEAPNVDYNLPQDDREIHRLEEQRNALLSRLQKEEFFSKKYEDILQKHQELVSLLGSNIENKANFDAEYSQVYKSLVDGKLAQYDSNLSFLDQQLIRSKLQYQSTLEKLRSQTEALNKQLD
ncbi:hypothetical protein OGAPHI_004072 [Ogataea philodendri]|uniref:Uncharacterized protein n=1 Tax=Ogataea philodendri TaxID=1378263 RepID=A0A9P8T4E9_9ASCO|nr:uncharacterized protein OGAPHI_004072 [Ogataea philodendri]KAH3665883.1 hypothetical protein OGAPHI_004072 [Ogataea philodendri]